jgi:hypothetical protein
MAIWLILIGGAVLIGFLVAVVVKTWWAVYLAAAIPWFGLLGALLFTVYFVAADDPDASMWLIAQFVGGTVAALVGIVSFKLTKHLLRRKDSVS